MPEVMTTEKLLEMQLQSNKLKNQLGKGTGQVDFKSKRQADLYKNFMKQPPFFAKKVEVNTFARSQIPEEANHALKDARKRFE